MTNDLKRDRRMAEQEIDVTIDREFPDDLEVVKREDLDELDRWVWDDRDSYGYEEE